LGSAAAAVLGASAFALLRDLAEILSQGSAPGAGAGFALALGAAGAGTAGALLWLLLLRLSRIPGLRPGTGLVLGALPLAAFGARNAWQVLSGRRFLEECWAPAARAASALLAALSGLLLLALLRPPPGRTGTWPSSRLGLLVALLLACAVLDARVLPGSYPAFHHHLRVVALLLAAAAGAALARDGSRAPRKAGIAVAILGCSVIALALFGRFPPGKGPVRALLLVRAPTLATVLGTISPPPPARGDPSDTLLREMEPRPPTPEAVLEAHFPGRRSWNLLILSLDAVRMDRTSFGPRPRDTTPRLRAFAEEAILFRRAYASSPSSPHAYATLLTGLHTAAVAGVVRGEPLPIPGLPAELAAHGRMGLGLTAFHRRDFLRSFRALTLGFEGFVFGEEMPPSRAGEILARATLWLEVEARAPWFLWVHLLDPHHPYTPHPGHDFGPTPEDHYDSEIAYTDAEVGRFLDRLRERPDWERTVVLVHSDHGEAFGEHGARHHGSTLHEEQIHVPLLFRIPGLGKGCIETPAGLADLAPTLRELLGLPHVEAAQGRSLVPLLLPRNQAARHGLRAPPPFAFAEILTSAGEVQEEVLIGPRYKLRRLPRAGASELFDLEADPGERRPLASDPTGGDLALRLDAVGALARGRAAPAGPLERPPAAEALARVLVQGPRAGVAVLEGGIAGWPPAEQALGIRALGWMDAGGATQVLLRCLDSDATGPYAALALAFVDDPGIPARLAELSGLQHRPATAGAAALARILRGEAGLEAAPRALPEQDPFLADLLRTLEDPARSGDLASWFPARAEDPPSLDLILLAAARTRALPLLLAALEWCEGPTSGVEGVLAAAWLARRLGSPDGLAFARALAGRGAAAAEWSRVLAEAGSSSLEEAASAARAASVLLDSFLAAPARGASEARRVLFDPLLPRDLGLLRRALSMLLVVEGGEAAGAEASRMARTAGLGPGAREFALRFQAVADTAERPVRLLRFELRPEGVPRVEAGLAAESGSLLGVPHGQWTHLRARLEAADGRTVEERILDLPALGVLAGEGFRVVLPPGLWPPPRGAGLVVTLERPEGTGPPTILATAGPSRAAPR
jgi:hypothetical protein